METESSSKSSPFGSLLVVVLLLVVLGMVVCNASPALPELATYESAPQAKTRDWGRLAGSYAAE